MGNLITEKYFDYDRDLKTEEKHILKEICVNTGFKVKEELFRGYIQAKNKIGSIIYKGIWRGRSAVLKLQALKPKIEEVKITKKFNKQNKSKIIRLPKIYDYQAWNKKKQYGYIIMEKIKARPIYKLPFATDGEMKEFCRVYSEYKIKALVKPLFKKIKSENSVLLFTSRRITIWSRIAKAKRFLTKKNIKLIEKFKKLATAHFADIKMEFMHGHYTIYDIHKISNKEYVFMSNLFWSYRPEYYDAAFNIWADILNMQSSKIKQGRVLSYYEKWVNEYKALEIIKKDKEFGRKMDMIMLERCVGALILDIPNKLDSKNINKAQYKHLNKLYTALFNYLGGKLNAYLI